jgi:hypothetical protein
MSDHPDTSKELVQKAAEKYSEVSALRAAVQLIPYIGGPLDTLIGGEGQKIQQRRIAHFIEELDRKIKVIETPKQSLEKEELYDLMVSVFEQVAKSRSIEKRVRFAQIISHEIATVNTIEDVELAIRLVGELDDLHIKILHLAIHAPASELFDGLKVLAFSSDIQKKFVVGNNTFPVLTNLIPDIPKPMLGLICSELISKGLLRDEGAGRPFIGGVKEYFVATDLAAWLFTWIRN